MRTSVWPAGGGRSLRGDAAAGLAPSCCRYLNLVGHTVVGWMWLRLATAAARPAAAADGADGFYCGKLHTAAYYFRHELPKTEPVAATLLSLDTTVREMRADWF